MKCGINYDTDPISLTIIAADGYEHKKLDEVGHGNIIDIGIHFDDEPSAETEHPK